MMGQEDQDFIMRQTKELAKGLAKLLGKEETEELLNYGQKQADDKDKAQKKRIDKQ